MKTIRRVLRRIRWLLDDGPRRLRSARLRRKGEFRDAFVELAGELWEPGLAEGMFNAAELTRFYRATSRVLSSPKISRRRWAARMTLDPVVA